jgi:hypothetical protein
MFRKFVIVFFIAAALTANGQIVPEARLDTDAMLIGDHVGMTMKVSIPAGTQVAWPAIPDTILDNLRVIRRSAIDSTTSKDKKTLTLTQTLVLTSFDSGIYTIPPILFRFRKPPDTTVMNAETRYMELAVHTVAVDTTKAIKPIKGPMKAPWTFRDIFPWVLAAILAGLLVWFTVYYIRKRRKAEPLIRLKPRVQLLPHEIALTELEKLRIKKLWQEGKVKEYHSELTDIIRKYLEGRFRFNALESTTGEIMDELGRFREVVGEQNEKLREMLSLADLVKFAKAQPLPEENERGLEDAILFVRETMVRPEPEPITKTE